MSAQKCRLCLNEMYVMENIFQYNEKVGYSLVASIYMFFGIEVTESDGLTKMICHNCIQICEYIQMYRKKFQNNQRVLNPQVNPSDILCNTKSIMRLHENQMNVNGKNGVKRSSLDTKSNNVQTDEAGTQTETELELQEDYVCVPYEYLNSIEYPVVVIDSCERNVVDEKTYCNNLGRQIRSMGDANLMSGSSFSKKQRLIKYYYSRNTEGSIRELIRDKAKKTMFIKECINQNINKTIYEYNLNMSIGNYDPKLFKVNVQENVFVCCLCNDIFSSKRKLNNHKVAHMHSFFL